MADTGVKKKGKKKGKTVPLTTFLSNDTSQGSGSSVVYAAKSSNTTSWADESEDLPIHGSPSWTDPYAQPQEVQRIVLPTAPRAARAGAVDLSSLPKGPPYTAFLGNLPYDVEEDDIFRFFQNVQVKDVRLPRESENGRLKGFGYAEFDDIDVFLRALTLDDQTLKGRRIRVDVAGQSQGADKEKDNRGREQPSESDGDWRSAPRNAAPPPGRDSREMDGRDQRRGYGNDNRVDDREWRSSGDRRGGFGDRGGYGSRGGGFGGDRGGYGDRGGGFGSGDRDGYRGSGGFGDRGGHGSRGGGFEGDRGGYGGRDNSWERDGDRDGFRNRRGGYGGRDGYDDRRQGDRGGFGDRRGFGDRDGFSGRRDYGDRGYERDRGFGNRDRGFGDRDRGFGDRDRGFGDRDRGFGDRDRGFGDRDRGFSDRGFGDRDRGYGDRDRGYGDRDRGFGERDRGFGDKDRGGYGDRDRGGYGDRDRGYGDKDRASSDRDSGSGDRGYNDRESADRRRDNEDRDVREKNENDRKEDESSREAKDETRQSYKDERGVGERREENQPPMERPRLLLKPRSKPKDGAPSNDPNSSASSAIFGGAKPVDTATRELEIAARLEKESTNKESSAAKVSDSKGGDRRRFRSTSSEDGENKFEKGPSPSIVKRSGERGETEAGRGGSRSDRGRGRGKGSGRGGKREPKVVEPKKYEEPEVKVWAEKSKFSALLDADDDDVDFESDNDEEDEDRVEEKGGKELGESIKDNKGEGDDGENEVDTKESEKQNNENIDEDSKKAEETINVSQSN